MCIYSEKFFVLLSIYGFLVGNMLRYYSEKLENQRRTLKQGGITEHSAWLQTSSQLLLFICAVNMLHSAVCLLTKQWGEWTERQYMHPAPAWDKTQEGREDYLVIAAHWPHIPQSNSTVISLTLVEPQCNTTLLFTISCGPCNQCVLQPPDISILLDICLIVFN